MGTPIIFHPKFLDHHQGPGHPESRARLEAVRERLTAEGLWDQVVSPGPAPLASIERVHAPAYVEMLRSMGEGRIDGDTASHPETYDISVLSAGGALAAVDRALAGDQVMALLRPPGHHATPDSGMGFCYLNNIAIAAEEAARRGRRAAIVDIDLHHGNGTEQAFYERDDVLFVSTHQWGIYPGTGSAESVGEGRGKGFTVNVPFPGGAGDSAFEEPFVRVVLPVLRQFRPDVILVSYGADGHARDPLGDLRLTSSGYVGLTRHLRDAARELCGGRIAYLLEGGYDLGALGECMAGTLAMLRGGTVAMRYDVADEVPRLGHGVAERVARTQAGFWDLPAPGTPDQV